jgi:D-glycero-D-manno-heptose 1,7-bisphosphate phosphatase
VIKQAVILCGGKGTRLGQVTTSCPKPLIKVNGSPFLTTLIRNIARYGFTEVLLLAGHLGDQIHKIYDQKCIGNAVCRVLVEPKPLGTAGSLLYFQDQLETDFLLLNGDTLFDIDLLQFALKSASNKEVVTVALSYVSDTQRYGRVTCKDTKIETFHEKVVNSEPGLINSGTYFIRKEIFNYFSDFEKGMPASLEGDILPLLLKDRNIASFDLMSENYFIDIGLPESLHAARTTLASQLSKPAVFFDRDNTLNVDDGYTFKTKDLLWKPGARSAVRLANQAGYHAFVVSNQSGIGRGFYKQSDVVAFHKKMNTDLAPLGGHIDDFIICPHVPDENGLPNCICRKPNTGMINVLQNRWSIDMSKSIFVGDSVGDRELAERLGLYFLQADNGDLNNKLILRI